MTMTSRYALVSNLGKRSRSLMKRTAAKRMRMTPSMPPATTIQSLSWAPVSLADCWPMSPMAATIESTAKAMSVSSMTRTAFQKRMLWTLRGLPDLVLVMTGPLGATGSPVEAWMSWG